MGRRWLKLVNPEEVGLPDWVEYVCPKSYVKPNCVFYDENLKEKQVLDRAGSVILSERTELFDILERGQFAQAIAPRADYLGQGAVIGEQPFKVVDGKLITARGGVYIGKNVSIGANTVIDRGIYGEFTEIHDGTHIDNLVHVGHSARIHEGSVIVAGCVLGGWSEIGAGTWLSMGVRVLPHIRVGEGSLVGASTVVNRDLPPNSFAYGVPMRIRGGACCMKKLEFQGTLATCATCLKVWGMKEDGSIVEAPSRVS